MLTMPPEHTPKPLVFGIGSLIFDCCLFKQRWPLLGPLCYASLLDDRINDETNRDHVLNLMKFDWLSISVCETSHTVQGSLTTDLGLTMTPPCRLLMILCESHRFRELPSEGKDLLRAMIHIPADSKIIEDVHQCVRLAQKTRASHEKLGVPAVQNLVNNSKVMASRDLNHPAKLDKQSFLSTLRQTSRNFKTREKCYGRRHKLPKSYGRTMSTKLWPSITPASLGRSAAAWAFAKLKSICVSVGSPIRGVFQQTFFGKKSFKSEKK